MAVVHRVQHKALLVWPDQNKLFQNVHEIMKEYIRLAKGGQALGGTAMTIIKDAVGKWIPPAKQEIDVGHGVQIVRIIAPKYD